MKELLLLVVVLSGGKVYAQAARDLQDCHASYEAAYPGGRDPRSGEGVYLHACLSPEAARRLVFGREKK